MKLPMSGLPLGYAKNQLAEEIAAGHDLVRLRGLGQVERLAHHAVQPAVARHVHHGGEAPAAPAPPAQQRQRPALEDRQVERDLAPAGRSRDDETSAGLETRAALAPPRPSDPADPHTPPPSPGREPRAALSPHRRTDAVEPPVPAAAAGELLDVLAELRGRRVVDDLV